ncbi:anti-sigma factor [Roseibium sp.]|uniref:anti-sigma factor n=1 Tax=Roseibium sp. TaxID=1936156 RepID=UPI003D1171C2
MSKSQRWLAAEYALGVLENDDLREAGRLLDESDAFRREVEIWQDQLTRMNDDLPDETPPPHVWMSIENRLFGAELRRSAGLWQNLPFWRGFSFLSASAAALAIGLLVADLRQVAGPDTLKDGPLVATLTETGAAPAFIARIDPGGRQLVIRVATQPGGQDNRVPELWLIPGDGVPRSLGVLQLDAAAPVEIAPAYRDLIETGAALAVSLEPPGGSPSGAPTGPVIASGQLQRL